MALMDKKHIPNDLESKVRKLNKPEIFLGWEIQILTDNQIFLNVTCCSN